jgi:hypothetical protein
MRTRLIVLTLLFIAGIFAVLQAPDIAVSPGALIKGHEKIEGDCFQCHTPLLGPREKKCIACHKIKEIGAKKPDRTRFHQRLAENDCAGCHTDHIGRDAAKATRAVNHGLLGAGWQTNCHDCHAKPKDSMHKSITGKCETCHQPEKWRPATFEHARYFEFDRYHPADCASCHLNERYDRYTCYACHEHSEANVREEHLEEGIRDFENCTECHRSGDEDEAERIWHGKRQGFPGLRRGESHSEERHGRGSD